MASTGTNAADIFSSISGQWKYTDWPELRETFYRKSNSPLPNCALMVGDMQTHKYYTFKDHQNFNLHPFDYLHSSTPVINYVMKQAKHGEDCLMKVLPMFSFNADSIILAGAAGNTTAVIKIKAELDFKCLDSVTNKNLEQDIRSGTLKLSAEKKFDSIFQKVEINLSDLSRSNFSCGLNFKVLGFDYTFSCTPVFLGGMVNIFKASGTVKKSFKMEIDGYRFELDINMGYEAVIEQHNNIDQSAPILKIPGIATEMNYGYAKVKPIEVNGGIPQSIMNTPSQKILGITTSNSGIHASNNSTVNTFSWYETIKMYAYGVGLGVCAYLVSQNPNGVKSVKFSEGLKPPSATTMVLSAGFTAIVTGASAALAGGILAIL